MIAIAPPFLNLIKRDTARIAAAYQRLFDAADRDHVMAFVQAARDLEEAATDLSDTSISMIMAVKREHTKGTIDGD